MFCGGELSFFLLHLDTFSPPPSLNLTLADPLPSPSFLSTYRLRYHPRFCHHLVVHEDPSARRWSIRPRMGNFVSHVEASRLVGTLESEADPLTSLFAGL